MCDTIRTPLCNKMLFSVRYRMGCWGDIGLVGGGRLFWKPDRLSGNSPEGPVMGASTRCGWAGRRCHWGEGREQGQPWDSWLSSPGACNPETAGGGMGLPVALGLTWTCGM